MEQRLRAAIVTSLMPASRAGLTGMPGVYFDHRDTACLCFVLDKRVQLGKAPTMQSALIVHVPVVFAPSHLRCFTDVREVFQREGRASGSTGNDAFREDMVMIGASPKLCAAQLLEVSPGRAAAFGLQLSLETQRAPFLFLPSALPQEQARRGDSRAIQTQINPDHFFRRGGHGLREGDDDMQGEMPLALTQIGRADLVTGILREVSGNREGQFDAPFDGRQAIGVRRPLDPIRAGVIADTGHLTARATNRLEHGRRLAPFQGFLHTCRKSRLFLLRPRQRTLDAFSGTDTGRAYQLRGQIGELRPQGIVGAFVQLHAVATLCRKALMGNGIVARGMLGQRLSQQSRLFLRGREVDNHRSIHTENIS